MADITARLQSAAARVRLPSVRLRVPRVRLHRNHRPSAQPHELPFMRGPVNVSLGLIALITLGASAVSMAESWDNLVRFARTHGWDGWQAVAAPGMVDVFILVGELWLLVCYALGLGWRHKARGWCVLMSGLVLSVSGNIWHVRHADIPTRLSFAIAPSAAAAALYVGLMAVKLYAERRAGARNHEQPADAPAVASAGAVAAAQSLPPRAARRPASTRRPPVQSGPQAGGAVRAQSAGTRTVKPAAVPSADDPPLDAIKAAISGGTSMRAFARLHELTNWRAQALYAPGSYANPVTAVNGHAVLTEE